MSSRCLLGLGFSPLLALASVHSDRLVLKTAPACHRDPGWPDPEFRFEIPEKNTPRSEIQQPAQENNPENGKNGRSWYFSSCVLVFSTFKLPFLQLFRYFAVDLQSQYFASFSLL